jgi:hypothetical protein
MRTAFIAERPDDPNAWIKGWFDDAGLKSPSTTTDNSSKKKDDVSDAKKRSDAGPPISNKGPAAPGGARDPDQISLERPLELTKSDIARLRSKHGVAKADDMIRDRVNAFLRTVKLTADPRKQN